MYTKSLTKEIKKIIKDRKLNCSVKEFEDYEVVDWSDISHFQKLSEEFIREFKNKVDWHNISCSQKLSEEFIKEFKNKVNWCNISKYQKLSEEFIRKFNYEICWVCVSRYQKLSEEFIREFKDKVTWSDIFYSQKLSEEFIREFNLIIPKNNWLYVSEQVKENYVKNHTQYKIEEDDESGKYILAYKGIRKDNYSNFNFQYYYEIGKEYESTCDCSLYNENSFGLAAWTLEKAMEYCNEKIILVKIYIKDIGAIVQNNNKIRCFKFKVVKEI